MSKKIRPTILGFPIILGAIWGLSEAALGIGLKSCASLASGSIMTGVAVLFMAGCWVLTESVLGITLLVVVASLFKMFDALLLSLPLHHGAIANPIFAFLTEGLAFFLLITVVQAGIKQKKYGQALTGGLAALLAVNLFPLVKYVTGIPACVLAGTNYPLSLYYAPLAVGISLFTAPLGFWAGAKIKKLESRLEVRAPIKRLNYLATSAALILCLALMVLIRLG
jgi:hypothetical protein